MKTDDSSLDDGEYRTVHEAARKLLNRGDAWGTFPTPVDNLLAAADLTVAPVSAFDENAMMRYLRQAGEQAEKLLLSAIDKVLGIFDVHANVIHIDPSLSKPKQTFLKLHETGHKELPHQNRLYRWIQDCRKHIAPEVAALFEREANTFASIVLFQDDAFTKMTADSKFGIKVPLQMAGKFGASVYAGIREYVRHNACCCAVIILDPTETQPDTGPAAPVRRVEYSPSFLREFGLLALPDRINFSHDLMRFVPLGSRKMSSPNTFPQTDLNGISRECIGEGFKTPYNTFVLVHVQSTLPRRTTLIMPATAAMR